VGDDPVNRRLIGAPTIGLVVALLAAALADVRADAPGASPPAQAIEEVRRAYAQCRQIQKQATPVELYQRRSGNPEVRAWQRELPAEAERTGRTMKLFTAGGTLRASVAEVEAPSGDWQQTIEHCFRSDGSVAFVLTVLRTFHGDVQVEDRLYFNPRGERIRTLRNVSDLKTGKPVKPDEASFISPKPQLFRTADELLKTVGPAALPGAK